MKPNLFNWPIFRLHGRHVKPIEWTIEDDAVEDLSLDILAFMTFIDINVLCLLLSERRWSIETKLEEKNYDDVPLPTFSNGKDSRWTLSDVIQFIEDRAVSSELEEMKKKFDNLGIPPGNL